MANLGRQLSRRGENETEEGLRLVEESLEHGERKRGRLSTASFCQTDNVAALEGNRDRLFLDRGRVLVVEGLAGFAQGIDNSLRELEADSR